MTNSHGVKHAVRFRAILFDLDGTIADFAHCGVLATHKTFEAFGLRVPPREEVIGYMGIPIEDSFPLLDSRLSDHVLRDQVIASFRAEYRVLGDQHICLFPGIADLLKDLKATATPMAIVTSKHGPVARRNLDTLGITDYFQVIVGPEKVAKPKPAPDIAQYALTMLGIDSPGEVLVVGDTSFDIVMGHSAFLQTCAVAWGAHSPEQLAKSNPTFQAAGIDELRSLLLRDPPPAPFTMGVQS